MICVHFIGFRDEAYYRAVTLFGEPHFIHRSFDVRAVSDIAPDDVIIFARSKDWKRYQENNPDKFSFNDSECF